MFDTIIIGAGPAGMTAGIYAARREMKTLIISKEVGGQLLWASEIENYPGFKSINNNALISNMREQVEALGVEIKIDEVKKIQKQEDGFLVFTSKDKFISKTLIIAMGLLPRRLAILGEEKLLGKGVSYCANCDAPIFKGKNVAVVGGGNSAFDAADLLSKLANVVYLINRTKNFKAFEVLVNEVQSRKNVKVMLNTEIKELIGEKKLEKAIIFNSSNNKSEEILLDGVFIEIGRIAHTDLLAEFVERDKNNQIIVDEKTKTRTEGIFAAGDITTVPFKQITIACGQATTAALAAYEYLQQKKGEGVNLIVDRSIK